MEAEQKYYENDSFWNPKNIHPGEKKRIRDTYRLLPKYIKSIADIGCRNGIFANYVKKKNNKIKIVGVDRSSSALKYVKTDKIEGDITDLPFKDKEYDLSVALEIIEHLNLKDYESALKELSRISKNYILISVPNNEVLKNNFVECPKCRSQFSRSLHKRSFDEEYMKTLFKKYHFKSKYVKYIGPKKSYLIVSPLYSFINKFIQKRSPNIPFVCPVCGFTNKDTTNKKDNKINNRTIRSRLVTILNMFWPKYIKYKWIIALYEKDSN